jgi:RNA-directed DNA polymerase
VLLDEVDKELERRGHCFVRYADDANVYVRSRRAGERVMRLLRRLYARLRLTVNEAKSTIASVFRRKFLGYSFWVAAGGKIKRRVADKAIAAFKQRVRELTRDPAGTACTRWSNNCGSTCWDGKPTSGWRILPGSGRSGQWMRHRVRAIQLKQWKRGTTTYRELRRGVLHPMRRHKWRPIPVAGGATAECFCIRC